MKPLMAAFCLAGLAAPSSAQAFSDPGRFALPALEGGGGGRQFTGAPGDGFGCGVCHEGGPEPVVAIAWRNLTNDAPVESALPRTFIPGATYNLTLSWPPDRGSHALQMELMDDLGRSPPVTLPPAAEANPASRCDEVGSAPPAFYAHDLGFRRVVGVLDCGASEVSLSFTAPPTKSLTFALGVVLSNSAGDSQGDGVLEVRHELRAEGTPLAGCSLSAAGGSIPSVPWACLALVAGRHLRRRHSKRKATYAVVSSTDTRSSPRNSR
ncbi:MAG: hypothetical protein KA712_23750 [Myxococcales bacterium]|nr:hypothetical protein [Myxococcales bacterium]